MNKNALRYVQCYDPSVDLADVVYYDNEGKPKEDPEKFLETKFRLLWFHHYLTERGVPGYVDDSEVTYNEAAQTLLAKATVYIDGKMAGRSCAGMFYSPAVAVQDMSVVQSLETQAVGRALANAGFSTVECFEGSSVSAAVAGATVKQGSIRACGYDPTRDLVPIPQNGIQVPYLNIMRQVQWFNRYLAEKRLEGYIDNSEVSYDPASKLFTVTASVYIGGNLVGRSAASRPFDPNASDLYDESPVLRAGTAAMGRALAYAGFGVVTSVSADERVPCDAGVKITKDQMGTHILPVYQKAVPGVNIPRTPNLPEKEEPTTESEPEQPVKERKKPGRKPKAAVEAASAKVTTTVTTDNEKGECGGGSVDVAVEVSAPMATPTAPVPQIKTTPAPAWTPPAPVPGFEPPKEPTMAREMALQYVIPLGTHKGKTIGEVLGMANGQNLLAFYASDRFNNPRYEALKRAVIAALK